MASENLKALGETLAKLSIVIGELNTVRVALNEQYNKVVGECDVLESNALPPLVERVRAMLSVPEFKYRTMYTLIDQLSASRDQILDALDDASVAYVIHHRNHDGAELVGLYDRVYSS